SRRLGPAAETAGALLARGHGGPASATSDLPALGAALEAALIPVFVVLLVPAPRRSRIAAGLTGPAGAGSVPRPGRSRMAEDRFRVRPDKKFRLEDHDP